MGGCQINGVEGSVRDAGGQLSAVRASFAGCVV